jgi:hypothetical protein
LRQHGSRLGPKPNGGRSPDHGSGTTQPARPTLAPNTYTYLKDNVAGGAAATLPDPIFIGVLAAHERVRARGAWRTPTLTTRCPNSCARYRAVRGLDGVVEAPFKDASAA